PHRRGRAAEDLRGRAERRHHQPRRRAAAAAGPGGLVQLCRSRRLHAEGPPAAGAADRVERRHRDLRRLPRRVRAPAEGVAAMVRRAAAPPRRLAAILPLTPAGLIFLGLFVLPLAWFAAISLWSVKARIMRPDLTFGNYLQ